MSPLVSPYIRSIQTWKVSLRSARTPEAYKDTMRRIRGCKEMIEFYRKREKETSK